MKLHQSHLNERRGHNMQYEDSQKEEVETEFNQRANYGKNGNSNSHIRKNNQFVSFGRIMPRHINQDKESLYEDNIKLKQKIKILEDQNLKLKTRMNVAEKQKQQILAYYGGMAEYGVSRERPGSKSMGRNLGTSKSSFQKKSFVKKMIRDNKDEIEYLKTENGRIKKSVKYTQIMEIQAENERLMEETMRLEEYIRHLIENENYDEYEAEINQLRKKIQMERDSAKNVHFQMKKKTEECDELREKLKESQMKHVEKEKKLSRDISTLRGELQKRKEDKFDFVINTQKGKKSEKISAIQKDSKKFQNYERQNSQLKEEVQKKVAEIKILKQRLKQKESQISNLEVSMKAKSPQKTPQKSQEKVVQKKKEQKETKKEKTQQNQYQDEFEKDNQELLEIDSDKGGNEEESYNKGNEEKKKSELKNQYEQYENEYDEDFGDEAENSKMTPKKQVKEEKNEDEEEVLFKKDEKPKEKKKKKEKKVKEKTGEISQEQIVKETITYKLMAQRYTFRDFQKDIKDSQVDEFTVEELATMLNNEPFFLVDEYLESVLTYCFGKANIELEDSLPTKTFMKKMKNLIGEIKLMSEEQEEKSLIELARKFNKNFKKLLKAFKKLENEVGTVSKEDFVGVLKQNEKLSEEKIELCLGQACLISLDINHINYADFLKRFEEGGESI